VLQLLLEQHTRLLTLVGPGGTGKTRLAIAIGEQVADDFVDGVAFVSLASTQDSTLTITTIAQALGVRESGDMSLLASLTTFLQARQMLLILDNFEHLVAAAPVVADLLAACPGLTVLVTSRSVLHLYGEHVFEVTPLALPSAGTSVPVALLAEIDAIRLFVERARAARAGFELTDGNAQAVAAICARLDGLPLAIELAAARVRVLSPAALLARLEHRLKVLTGGPQDVPARQQTMGNTIAWSYSLLTDEQQGLLRQLAVFSGGWTLEAAEAVSVADAAIVDEFSALVDQSLIRQRPEPHGSTRFEMLETIREFALDELTDRESMQARQRHAEFFVEFAESLAQHYEGPRQIEIMDQLEQEHDNIRAALDWFVSRGEATAGLRLAGAMWQFWHLRGYLTEGRQQYARLFALPDLNVPPRVRAVALTSAGALALWQQDAEATLAHHEAALRIWKTLPVADQAERGLSLICLGDLASDQGRLAEAQAYYDEALAHGHRYERARGVGAALMLLGRLAYIRGERDKMVPLLRKALSVARNAGDLWILSLALQHLGTIALDCGDFAEAEAMLDEALDLDRRLGAKRHLVHCQVRRAWLDLYRGQPDASVPRTDEAIAIARELGERTLTAYGLSTAGWGCRLSGSLDRADSQYREAITLAREVDDPIMTIMILDGITHLYVASGRMKAAVMIASATSHARDAFGNPPTEPDRLATERSLATARQRLSPEQFSAAWEAGLTLSLDDGIGIVLDSARIDIRRVPEPITGLTRREIDVLRLIAASKADKEIAAALSISPYTVMRHVQNILAKLSLPSRTAAATWAMRNGIVNLDDPSIRE
jgi:predicted ATPase/DNA-binding NarL/FixJ family response regulator